MPVVLGIESVLDDFADAFVDAPTGDIVSRERQFELGQEIVLRDSGKGSAC